MILCFQNKISKKNQWVNIWHVVHCDSVNKLMHSVLSLCIYSGCCCWLTEKRSMAFILSESVKDFINIKVNFLLTGI